MVGSKYRAGRARRLSRLPQPSDKSELEIVSNEEKLMKANLLVTCVFLFLAGCSTVQTQRGTDPLSMIQQNDRFQLFVRTGNEVMDKLLYELAYQQFSDVLPLREKEPFTGVIEIAFASTDQSGFVGSSSTFSSAKAHGSGWYTRSGYVGGTAYATGTSSTIGSGSSFTWQNSTMLIVIKRSDGDRIWTADYNYKGGWEMSGWVVNTPEEAARLVLKRLKEKFKSDFEK